MFSLSLLWPLLTAQGDSAALLRNARRAQADFEWTRRTRLPLVVARSGRGCDAQIGRFCYWHDAERDDPPREPASIGVARNALIFVLDSVAAALPGDDWIAGQRVRYLVESDRAPAALAAARACRGDAWWCEALAGFALHAAGEFVAADSVYAAALRDMPRDERCRWSDLSALLDGPLRRLYRLQSCEQRAALESRLWWLAQPLHSRPGNDRRTEHYARRTMARLLRHAWSPYGAVGGDDVAELIVRYGWPVAWGQATSSATATDRSVVGYDREPAYHFLPDAAGASSLTAVRPRERYPSPYVATFSSLEPQIAAFRRGDSTLVVAAYDVTHDTLFRGRPTAAALVLARGDGDALVIERRVNAEASGVLAAAAPWPARLASLEITTAPRAAARARVALPPGDSLPHGFALSDLLVFDPSDSLPGDLAAVVPRVRGAATVARGERIGLYWEVYGLAPSGEPVAMSVSVVPEKGGWLRRAAESFGIASRGPRMRIEWQEQAMPRAGFAPRVLVVDVSTLPAGRFRVEVAGRQSGRSPATAVRAFRVVEP